MTIKDYKNSSESDIEIVVQTVKDDTDPMGKILYEGCLGDCPEKLDGLKIDIVGRSLKAQQEGKTLYYLKHIDENKEDNENE